MADFTITITVPDAKVADLQAGLKMYYGQKNNNGVWEDYTLAELKALFTEDVKRYLANHYKNYVKSQAAEPDLGAT